MIAKFTAALSVLAISLSPAFADPFNVNFTNDEGTAVFLTVTDMNLPTPAVTVSTTVNSGQMISVNINGENGHGGHIQWKSQSMDRAKCGSDDVSDLSSGSNIRVTTPSSC